MLELSQRELAARAGIGEKHLGEIERGLRDPRLSTVLRLLDALDLTPAEAAAFWVEAVAFRPSRPWRGADAPGGDPLAYVAGSEPAHERGRRNAEAERVYPPAEGPRRTHVPSGSGGTIYHMPGNRRFVSPNSNGGWDVNKPGASRSSSHHDTQSDAQSAARGYLRNSGGGELITQGRNGQIRDKDTVSPGHDPYPPKG